MAQAHGEVFSLPEVCRTLGLGYFRVYGMILRGELPAAQDRKRHYWISRESLERLRKKMTSATSGKTRRSNSHNSDRTGRRRATTTT
jgi:excisionase family DNA binding protein